MSAEYAWTAAARVRADAQAAGEEFERIRARHAGVLHAEDVVKASRRKTAPLHNEFEWDDATAANNYRLDRARYLIRTVTVTFSDRTDAGPVRAFVNVSPDPEGTGYSAIREVAADADMSERYHAKVQRELDAFVTRHREHLAALDLLGSAQRLQEALAA